LLTARHHLPNTNLIKKIIKLSIGNIYKGKTQNVEFRINLGRLMEVEILRPMLTMNDDDNDSLQRT
jgi:hypothetical protein